MGELSAIALFFSLAWMSGRDAGYPIGGSQTVIQGIAHKLVSLGGRLRFGAKVERILVERDAAVGVQLTDGETITADWVTSAADGHATIYDLLGGEYMDKTTGTNDDEFETFPSYLQVSFGVALDLSQEPGFVTRLLAAPLQLDPSTQLRQISFRFFHFDPTFAPRGKTAVTCFLPTRNFEYWVHLQQQDSAGLSGRETSHRRDCNRHSSREAVPEVLQSDRGDRRLNSCDRHPLHRQLEGEHGRLARHHHRVPAITKHSARFAAVPHGGPMDYAWRWAAVRPADGNVRNAGRVPTRSDTLRGSTAGDDMTRQRSFTFLDLGLAGVALISGQGLRKVEIGFSFEPGVITPARPSAVRTGLRGIRCERRPRKTSDGRYRLCAPQSGHLAAMV